MVRVTKRDDKIIFTIKGFDKLLAFRSSITIPAEHIKKVYANPNVNIGYTDGIRLMGTSIPALFRAGIFYQQGQTVFWDVHNTDNAIVIELEHENFNKLIIEVENPVQAINIIKRIA